MGKNMEILRIEADFDREIIKIENFIENDNSNYQQGMILELKYLTELMKDSDDTNLSAFENRVFSLFTNAICEKFNGRNTVFDRPINENVLVYVLRQFREKEKTNVLMVGQFRDIASEENKIHHQMLSLMNMLYSTVSVREKFGLHKNPFLTVCKQHLPDLELASYSSEEQNQKIKDYFAPNLQMDVTQRKKFTLKFVRMLTFFLERFNLKRKELVKVLKQVSLENMNDKLFGSSGKYSQAESSSNLKLLETGSKRRYVSCSVDDGVWAVGETAIKRYDPVGRLGVSGDSVFVQVCNGEKWTNEQIFSPTFIDVCITNQVEHVYQACNEKIA